MLEVHAILQRQRCNENMTEKTGTLSDAYVFSQTYAYKPPYRLVVFDLDGTLTNSCKNITLHMLSSLIRLL